ncbi:MAG: polyamine aminopropyltransferase [Candidatus Thermoplasmatota archaeon]|nr:polyamine aminopropyltransferase [Candidatus Thermoplasmatota archaeon]
MKLIENWFSERYSDNLQLSFRVMDQLLSVKTDFQRIDIFETYDFGKLMSIDGTVQLTERDEFVYHEMITMVPYSIFKGKMKTALIIGGGDGGTASQVLKLGLENIVNVEIDSHVVEVSRRYFPSISKAFNDPKVKLIIGDGIKYVHETQMKFDLIIIDSTDPVGPAEGLFNRKFYTDLKRILNRGGIVVTQSGSPFYQPKALGMAHEEMSEVFSNVKTYTAFIPSYPSGFWSFTMASEEPIKPDRESVKIKGKYFNADILEGSFMLPEFVKELIEKK